MSARSWTVMCLALAACAADPSSSGSPAASGESHFLMACDTGAACGDELVCLCGVCSTPCDDDAACGTVEAGAICSGPNACGEAAGGRVCTRPAHVTDADPADASLDDAVPADASLGGCVAPVDGLCPPETVEVVMGQAIDVDRQCVGGGFDTPISCVTLNPGGSTAYFCVQRQADGARFGIPNGNCLPGDWSPCPEDEFFMPAWPVCPPTAAPAPADAATCDPRDLGVWEDPPAPETDGAVQRIDLSPDTLSIAAIVDGSEQTFTYHGPFAGLDPAALEGLDRLQIRQGDGARFDFIASLRGCDRPSLLLVHASRGLVERTWGPVDALFDATGICGEASCPREYALSWEGATVPAGRSVDTLAAQIRAGHVTGCRGDPAAAALVEFAVLPRADVPTCPGAGPPGEHTPAFAMTDAAGALVAANEGVEVDRTDEVVATPDPADPGHVTLTPVAPDAGFGPLHLRTALALPADLFPPVRLRQWLVTPWHWNRVFELHDARGVRVVAVSGDPGALDHLTGLTATRGTPMCRMPWDVGVQDLRPLVLAREDDPPFTVDALGVTAHPGARVDLRASGDYLNPCVSDTPSGWVGFVAVWE